MTRHTLAILSTLREEFCIQNCLLGYESLLIWQHGLYHFSKKKKKIIGPSLIFVRPILVYKYMLVLSTKIHKSV